MSRVSNVPTEKKTSQPDSGKLICDECRNAKQCAFYGEPEEILICAELQDEI